MGNDWDVPKWRREGRTGPGPAAPKYSKRSDRNKVRGEKPVGNNGPYHWGNRPQPRRGSNKSGGGGHRPPKKSSGGGSKSMVVIAVSLLAVPVGAIASAVGYILHGHGVI